jgi:hypothetical protein
MRSLLAFFTVLRRSEIVSLRSCVLVPESTSLFSLVIISSSCPAIALAFTTSGWAVSAMALALTISGCAAAVSDSMLGVDAPASSSPFWT